MQLIEAQTLLGITADGKWGPQSYAAVARGIRDVAMRPALLDLHLTEHFTLREMIRSDNQMRDWETRNHPNASQLANLVYWCVAIGEPVRKQFGSVRVTSGFRSWTPSSEHGDGKAVDYEVSGVPNLTVCIWVRDNLPFKQLIREGYADGSINGGWIHTSAIKGWNGKKSIIRTPTGRAPYLAGLGT